MITPPANQAKPTTRIEIEDLMAQVRAMAEQEKSAAIATPHSIDAQASTSGAYAFNPPPQHFAIKQRYRLAELLDPPDCLFLQHAYLCLLGRNCDRQGEDHYLEALRTGSLSRVEILGRLRFGPEGRKVGVRVTGLLIAFIWNTFARALSRVGLFLSGGIRRSFLR